MESKQDFNKIIISVDGSESSFKAAKKAFLIAKNTGIEVLAIYVSDVSSFRSYIPGDQNYDMWEREKEEEGQRALNDVEKIAEEMDTNVKTMMLKGTPEDQIIKQAKKDDLIVMGAKGHSAIKRIFIGSVSEKVLHHTKASVMIVR